MTRGKTYSSMRTSQKILYYFPFSIFQPVAWWCRGGIFNIRTETNLTSKRFVIFLAEINRSFECGYDEGYGNKLCFTVAHFFFVDCKRSWHKLIRNGFCRISIWKTPTWLLASFNEHSYDYHSLALLPLSTMIKHKMKRFCRVCQRRFRISIAQ